MPLENWDDAVGRFWPCKLEGNLEMSWPFLTHMQDCSGDPSLWVLVQCPSVMSWPIGRGGEELPGQDHWQKSGEV
jgi:hypothetical protein